MRPNPAPAPATGRPGEPRPPDRGRGRRYLIAAALVAAFVSLLVSGLSRPAFALENSASIQQIIRNLNGRPLRAGVLTSADGGVISATFAAGETLMVLCQPDSTGHVNIAATCSNVVTNAAYCPPIIGQTATYFMTDPGGGQTTVSMVPSDAGVMSCPYFYMR